MSDLDRLFYWRGIAADYLNFRGEHVSVPVENRIKLLQAMGVDVSSPKKIAAEAYSLDVEPWQHCFPKLIVSPSGEQAFFEINLSPKIFNLEFSWFVEDSEGKKVAAGIFKPESELETGEYLFEDERYSRRKIFTGPLEPNYYTLHVNSGAVNEITTFAVYPEKILPQKWRGNNEKVWGVIIQLYTLKTESDWGIGDFSDLNELIKHLAKTGADAVGLNPLHALSADLDTHYSPYSPSDRRFINPLYIDVTKVEGYKSVASKIDLDLLEKLRADACVDYTSVRNLKYSSLQLIFDLFLDSCKDENNEAYEAFSEFLQARGTSLLEFSYYEACHQNWQNATCVLRNNESLSESTHNIIPLNIGSLSGAQRAVVFHAYLQWISDTQLADCQNTAVNSGMKIGLIRDLAVGADGGGAEVSSNKGIFCQESAIGAPPDPLAQTGQNWGLPPVIPSELRKSGFQHMIDLYRSNMLNCGALRIDHAMSLMRLWWCPPAKTADHGAYVYYPFEEMLGLLALESYLNNCIIIGEDLGVVPDEFRDAIKSAEIFSNKVFYFEKNMANEFRAPEEYYEHSLAMVNNHDVPTLLSWWNGSDLELRRNLNLLEPGVDYKDICAGRAVEKKQILTMLFDHNLYPESWHGAPIDKPADEDLIGAILLLLSTSKSQIFVIQLEDLLLMDEPVNVPGTFKEHRNWQRKLSHSLEEMFSQDRIVNLLKNIDSNRKS